jgi:hypothetical protein
VLTGVFGIPYYRDTNPVFVADKMPENSPLSSDRPASRLGALRTGDGPAINIGGAPVSRDTRSA